MASVPPPQSAAHDDSRLPWLDGGSAGAGATVTETNPGSSGSGIRWIAGLLIVALVAAGAFFLGRKSDEPRAPVVTRPLATTPLAPARPTRPAIAAAPPAEQQTAPALARADAESARSVRRTAPTGPILHLRPEQLRDVRRIAREARVRVHRNRVPPKARVAYSPRAGAPGRVVQLGAYRTAADAEAAAQKFRYKYRGLLAAVPKAVLPFRPKNSRRMFYRVQFVVPSQAYAEVTCQRLRAAAKTCIVVY